MFFVSYQYSSSNSFIGLSVCTLVYCVAKVITLQVHDLIMASNYHCKRKAVAILPSTAIYPQRLFCRELFVIGQS